MSAPQTIAHYRIISELAEGGMGEVCRASNTRLNREVAVRSGRNIPNGSDGCAEKRAPWRL
jgi:hypothetical protein